MIRPTTEFDDAGGSHHEDRPASASQATLLRETAREIVRLSPNLAAILCRAGAEKVTSIKPGGVFAEG